MAMDGPPTPKRGVEERSDGAPSTGVSTSSTGPEPEVVAKPKPSNPLEPKVRELEAKGTRLEKELH